MGEAAEQMEALADAEISRLINLSRKTGFARDEDAPVRRQASFRKRTLVEIAMQASQKQAAAEAEATAETPAPPAEEAAGPDSVTPDRVTTQAGSQPAPQPAKQAAVEQAGAEPASEGQSADTPQDTTQQDATQQDEADQDPAELAKAEQARAEAAEKQRAEQMQADYDRGHAAGLAEGRASATAELEQVVAAFEKALAGLAGPGVLQLDQLRQKIEGSVLALASARAGSQIDTMPEAFADRVEQLISRIKEATEAPLILLAEEDYRLIAPLAQQREKLAHCRFAAEAGLARGDVRIIAGGIGMDDRLMAAARKEETEAEAEAEAVSESSPDEAATGETLASEAAAVEQKEAGAEDDQ